MLEAGCIPDFQLRVSRFQFPASSFQLLAPSNRFNAKATARIANGSASTCGCMSASKKLKNGNSSINSLKRSVSAHGEDDTVRLPAGLQSCTTRDARHHHR